MKFLRHFSITTLLLVPVPIGMIPAMFLMGFTESTAATRGLWWLSMLALPIWLYMLVGLEVALRLRQSEAERNNSILKMLGQAKEE
jgi:hypothetical protein